MTDELRKLFASVLQADGASPSAETVETLVARFDEARGLTRTFWSAFEEDYGPQAVDAAQFALRLCELTGPFLPLVQELLQRGVAAADLHSLDWEALVQKVGLPADLPGASDADRRELYCRDLRDRARRLFPSALVLSALGTRPETMPAERKLVTAARSRGAGRAGAPPALEDRVRDFFERNPRFDLERGTPSRADDPEVAQALRSLKCLTRMVPVEEAGRLVLNQGLRSAQQMATLSPTAAIARLGVAAQRLRRLAAHHAAASLVAFARHSAAVNSVGLAAVPARQPEWRALFGSPDSCRFEEGRLLGSPNAYLVDLLAFLGRFKPRDGDDMTLRDALLDRRPDIADLPLSSEHAYSPIPYIDLVNDALESAMFACRFTIPWSEELEDDLNNGKLSDQITTAFAQQDYSLSQVEIEVIDKDVNWCLSDSQWQFRIELGSDGFEVTRTDCKPEALRAEAYALLRRKNHPWVLPFDLWAETARTYLEHLGLPRHRLMEIFASKETLPLEVASVYFGMPLAERQLVTGKHSAISTPWLCWGLGEEKSGEDQHWTAHLMRMPALLKAADLSYEQLLEALGTRHIKRHLPAGAALEVSGNASGKLEEISLVLRPADPDQQVMPQVFTALMQFLRLQRRTGWSIRELDWLLDAHRTWGTQSAPAVEPSITEDLLIDLYSLHRLQRDLDVPLAELLSWYGDIDTHGDAYEGVSLYDRLFLSQPSSVGDEAAFRLNEDRTELVDAAAGSKLRDHVSMLTAAFSIGEAELHRILDAEYPDRDASLSLANLSRLYRIVSLARRLGITTDDFLTLRRITGIDPFAAVDDGADAAGAGSFGPAATRRFAAAVDAVRTSGLGVPELDYLLGNAPTSEHVEGPGDDEVDRWLKGLRDGLDRLKKADKADNADKPDKAILPPEDDSRASSAMTFLRKQLAAALAIEDEQLVEWLMQRRWTTRDETTVAQCLLNDAKEKQADQQEVFRALRRSALLFQKLELAGNDLEWLKLFPGYEYLPLIQADGAPGRFASWECLVHLVLLRERVGREGLLTLCRKDYKDAQIKTGGTTLVQADLEALQRLGLLPLGQCQSEQLARLHACIAALGRLSVGAPRAIDWCRGEDENGERARQIEQTVRAKYDEARWREVGKPLQDALREKRRDALRACVLAKKGLPDANALYQQLLLDVEMSAAMTTSRTRAAISAVQLFVQRCLMSLERIDGQAMSLDPLDAAEMKAQWEWMKSYRVWEAALKVFLFPENWVEPELRRDKSTFFQELETELAQGEASAERLQRAYLNYLDKLERIARLEIVDFYRERETAAPGNSGGLTKDTLHVIGRTRDEPRTHYYRRSEDDAWTPWERVDLNTGAGPLIPIVHDGQLHLFWPVFAEKTEKLRDKDGKPLKGGDPESKRDVVWHYWEMQLAWSTYREGTWAAPQISERKLAVNPPPKNLTEDDLEKNEVTAGMGLTPDAERERENQEAFTFRTWQDGRSLKILCWCDEGQKPAYVAGFHFASAAQVQDLAVEELGKFTESHKPTNWRKTPLSSTPDLTLKGEGGEVQLLRRTPPDAKLVFSHQLPAADWPDRFFYQDSQTVFLAAALGGEPTAPEATGLVSAPPTAIPGPREAPPPLSGFPWVAPPGGGKLVKAAATGTSMPPEYRFTALSHPLLDEFKRRLNRGGVRALLSRATEFVRGARTLGELLSAERPHFVDNDKDTIGTRLNQLLKRRGVLGDHEWMDIEVGVRTRDGIPIATLDDWLSAHRTVATPRESTQVGLREVDRKPSVFEEWAVTYRQIAKVQYETGCICNRCKYDHFVALHMHCSWSQAFSCHVRDEGTHLVVYQDYDDIYGPTVHAVLPEAEVDFRAGAPCAAHNWELFFHAPLLLATRLSANRRHAEARDWFHCIFDPLDTSAHETVPGYWQFRPFHDESSEAAGQREALLLEGGPPPEVTAATADRDALIKGWRRDPFDPHAVARLRLGAYQKTVVMKYLDCLIAWGDDLFRQDTSESVDEATQLYVLAAEMLGRPPLQLPPPEEADGPRSFHDLQPVIDDQSGVLADLDALHPPPSDPEAPVPPPHPAEALLGASWSLATPAPGADTQGPYFHVPRNDHLLEYWDTVADRLFKIRHCMNIAGIVRTLPLYQPPIEPGMLVRAAQAGLGPADIVERSLELPHYRFAIVLEHAKALCNGVKALGGAFLSALEKKDARALERLQMEQAEPDIADIKQWRTEEAKDELAASEQALEAARGGVKSAQEEKQRLERGGWLGVAGAAFSALGKGTAAVESVSKVVGPRIKEAKPEAEGTEAGESEDARIFEPFKKAYELATKVKEGLQANAGATQGIAAAMSTIPTMLVGAAGAMGSPVSLTVIEPTKPSESWWRLFQTLFTAIESVLACIEKGIQFADRMAAQKSKIEAAEKLVAEREKQVEAARIRLRIAEKELEHYQRQQRNREEIARFHRERFTNTELYEWMVGQLATLYFETYQLAYDTARRAEKALHFELGEPDTTELVSFGHWDSLRKGLLAGEKLMHDLNRMEAAYLERNRRGYELTKDISLARLFPSKLLDLKLNGQCDVELGELLFDLDYPGHYLRRLRAVSLTIEVPAEPWTNINCTLTLKASNTRRSDKIDKYEFLSPTENEIRAASIATSTARDDAGLFQLRFDDERYLPFEGAGAVSKWTIELRQDQNAVDLRKVSDVVLRLRYTARDAGEPLREAARNAIDKQLKDRPFGRLFVLKHEFPEAWPDMLRGQPVKLPLGENLTPPMFRGKGIELKEAFLFLMHRPETKVDATDELNEDWKRSQDQDKSTPGLLCYHCQGASNLLSKPLPVLREALRRDLTDAALLVIYQLK